VNNELERMWKEAFLSWFGVVFPYVPGGNEESL